MFIFNLVNDPPKIPTWEELSKEQKDRLWDEKRIHKPGYTIIRKIILNET